MAGGVEVVSGFTSAAIQSSIAAVQAASGNQGGVVLLPAGVYSITSTINIPSKVTLQGAGKQTTILVPASDIIVLSIAGTAGGVNGSGGISGHVASAIVADLQVQSTNDTWTTNPRVRVAYAHTCEFRSCIFRNSAGVAFYVQCETWDTTWLECRWDNSGGTNTGKPAMVVQAADGATFPAFGSSTDATNDLRFYHCTWEGFKDGALWAPGGIAGANPVGNLYFFGCKADQNQTSLGDWFRFEGVFGVYLHDWDLSSFSQGSAYAGTPFTMFTFKACKGVTLKGMTHNQNSAATDCMFHFDGTGLSGNGNRYFVLDDINVSQVGSGSTSFATGMLRFTGTNLNYRFEYLTYPRYVTVSPLAIKPIFNLTSGTITYSKNDLFQPIGSKLGAYSDAADFGTQEPGLPNGIAVIAGVDLTNHRLYVRYADGTYKYAQLT